MFFLLKMTIFTVEKVKIFKIGFHAVGTYRLSGDSVRVAIDEALKQNYRLIDTARVYRNESLIGDCLKDLLPQYNLNRSDIFITSKVGPKDQGSGKCRAAVLESLKALSTEYIDLYLIHWPGTQGLKPDDINQKKLRAETWRDLEDLHTEGLLKSIGVSNYTVRHLEELLSDCRIKPAVLQNEYHPHLCDTEMVEFCRKNGIHFQAYSSLGTSDAGNPLITDPTVKKIADDLNRTSAQILLKWSIQQNIGVIPKSTNRLHIQQNIDLFSFTLSDQQMAQISSLNKHKHYCWNPVNIA